MIRDKNRIQDTKSSIFLLVRWFYSFIQKLSHCSMKAVAILLWMGIN